MSEQVTIGELKCTIIDATDSESGPESVVVLCHGFGAPGTDLVPLGNELINAKPELKGTVFVFPQAPIELDPHYDSRAWWMIDIEKIQALMQQGEVRELRNDVPPDLEKRRNQIVEVVNHFREKFTLPANKVAVGGFSQGAMLATDVALNYPDQLGGLIVWSGTLINEMSWLEAAKNKSPMNIVQSHGRMDPILPFAGAEFLRDMLVQNGHSVRFVPFDGQHGIAMEALLAASEMLEARFGKSNVTQ